ncbi:MAG TPA: hypothetical protein VES68_01950 [Candidatus Sulfotelmatobacter sp.]|nr:hypothetical protein [Candidatus Sulfotelmatobacter sp.]
MTEANLSFAKIVANPNVYSWSQAYNAGKLFAVLSLETQEEISEKDFLNVLGKEILDTLEQEFFTLEKKDLESIKNAILLTSEKIPQGIDCSFVAGAFVENVLYVYILGDGKVSLKRQGKLGHLLEANDQETKSIKVASGFLEDDDIIIFQTKQFSKVISTDTLFEMLDGLSPKDAAENIAPLLHEKDESGASSIIINYKKPLEEEVLETKESELDFSDKEEEKENQPFYASKIEEKQNIAKKIASFKNFIPNFKTPGISRLNHPKKVLLTIVVIILVVFVGSVFFALKKQESSKIKAAFDNIYPQASKKYEEGQGLIDLNRGLANDSFTQAKDILEKGESQFPKDSPEEKQILSLLAKVNSALGQTQTVNTSNVQAKQVDLSLSSLLSVEAKNSALYYSQSDKNIFALTDSSVLSFALDGTGKKSIIDNNSDWSKVGGLSNYFGNIYILDKKQNQILKYVAASSGFGKANYFSSDTNPDFSKAVSMAIDSSVYVLSSDGTIAKFTKGKSDNFTLSGLDKSFSSPTSIFTNADLGNIYILDKGNSRIVVLNKSGKYQTSYQASVIKSAKDFDVLEKDKKIYVLSSGKLFEIDLK